MVSSANSLVGSTTDDEVGGGGTTVLTYGNYVVSSPNWDNGPTADVGAATWCSGTTGCVGTIASANSLVGSTINDQVGSDGATALVNGNYVVRSPGWTGTQPHVGAATWCDGTIGRTGAVSAANSLVGNVNNDNVTSSGVTALTNGNYVVSSSLWNNGANTDAGAVTWCNGATGRTGTVLVSNSLVGSTSSDHVGNVIALTNGNYVVSSSGWSKTGPFVFAVGAATWCDGTIECTGAISASNSLLGTTTRDAVGAGGVVALSNGNYVVSSPAWDNFSTGFQDVGAATWCDGTTGRIGAVSASNALVGNQASGKVSNNGVTALTNGNYVVGSAMFRNPSTSASLAGAATWCNGTTGRTGVVSTSNSLVGIHANDLVSSGGVTALTNGNYVVNSSSFDDGPSTNAGAATWCNGSSGRIGAVSATNSLVGSTADDGVGSASSVMALSNGNYAIQSATWDNTINADAGAITLGRGSNGTTVGSITSGNSVRGFFSGGGVGLVFTYNARNEQLVVGRPSENIVSLFTVRGPTLTVTTIDDHTDGNCNAADCTLREAIQAANASSDDSTIIFAPVLTGIIQLTGALPDLTSNITLQGPGANRLTVRRNGGGDYRIFTITNTLSPALEINFSGISIANGNAPTGGPLGGDGGGIYNDGSAVTLSQATLSGNNAGGVHGGGIYNGHGILTVQNSTLSGNSATMGGGIYNDAVNGASAVMIISNSTLSSNTGSQGGGGIFNSSVNSGTTGVASLTVQSCTFSANTGNVAGGIYNDASNAGSATVELANALLKTGLSGANLFNSSGTMISQGHNLSSDSANGDGSTGPGGYLNVTGDIRNTDPQLDPAGLADNGGPTMTIALSSGSPAINAANDLHAPGIDQRGSLRFGLSDIGAFEFGGLSLRILSIVRLTNGHVTLQGSGLVNSVHRIEASIDPNSNNFFSIGTAMANGSGALEYHDSTAVGWPKQFYRLRFP